MAGSGESELVINPQERALSSDMVRMQRFRGLDFNEFMRWWFDVTSSSEDGFVASVATEHLTTEAPLRAEIINGLTMRPAVGTKDLTVDPGMIMLIDPDATSNSEDSAYKFIRDPGIPLAGTLQIDASTGGGIRIDVIECARVSGGVSVLETDSRDFFNSTTGLFSAATVNKVTAGRLRYRVRKGVDGGGFPGVVAGWLPIAVASVPNGSTTNDTVTFWDVRPLLSDRQRAPFAIGSDDATVFDDTQINARVLTSVRGNVFAQLHGRRVGGFLRQGTPRLGPEPEEGSLDVTSAENREAGFVSAASSPWYLYLGFPFGLPRWARYLNAAFAPRMPRSPCGIPVVSMTKTFYDGTPRTAIALPSTTGLGSSTTEALAVGAGHFDSGNTMRGFYGDNKTGFFLDTITGGNSGLVVAPQSADATQAVYQFDTGATIPSCARAVLVEFKYVMTATATAVTFVSGFVSAPNTGAALGYNPGGFLVPGVRYTAGDGCETRFAVWLPLPQSTPRSGGSGGFAGFNVTVTYGGSNITFNSAQARIMGWRF